MDYRRIPESVRCCLDTLRHAGYAAYPVGGCVRDLLLEREPEDYDLCTAAKPERVMELFPQTVPTGLKHGTVTVLLPDRTVEITTFRREKGYSDGRRPDRVYFDAGLEEDLARRDFTINAMALGESGELIDPFGGRADLSGRVIRCVGDADRRFQEDALRMLRAVRFGAQLDFVLPADTLEAVRRNAGLARQVSGERIRAELEKILLSPRPERAGELLELGLLEHLCPVWRAADLRPLGELPPEPTPRWQAFCRETEFPITVLPVERALRRAVLHPEAETLRTLALSGGALARLGLAGPEIGAMQRRLARHVHGRPEDNTQARLLELAEGWVEERLESNRE